MISVLIPLYQEDAASLLRSLLIAIERLEVEATVDGTFKHIIGELPGESSFFDMKKGEKIQIANLDPEESVK